MCKKTFGYLLSVDAINLHFANPAAVTAIQATVQVRKFEATGCASNLSPTFARAWLFGPFFNTGTPTAGSAVGDVRAAIFIERRSDSTDPEDVLRVGFLVFHCADQLCSTGTFLNYSQDLGPITPGESATLRIQWDPNNDQFIFQRDGGSEVFSPYTVSDTATPGLQFKVLAIA